MLSSRRKRLIRRAGESGTIPFRTGRFFNQNGAWYFMTREGRAEGPYREKQEAERAAETYARMAALLNLDSAPVFRTYSNPPTRPERAPISSGLIQ